MAETLSHIEKWSQEVHTVRLGAGPAEGGTRATVLEVGGEKTLPFLLKEGMIPHRPLIAAEVYDVPDADWPAGLTQDLAPVLRDPVAWAKFALKEAGADLICLRLQGIHPEEAKTDKDRALALTRAILKEVGVPLVVLGCGDAASDNEVLPAVSEATKGERLLFGDVVQENYKTLAAACVADGHNIVAESPIDVNIAKQLNILLTDLGVPADRIVINPTIGALGYGMEYAYSIMERARNAALSGDKMLAMPFICFVGPEAWKTKEAKAGPQEAPEWGPAAERGVMWEVVTALAMLQAGAGILTMLHPQAMQIVRRAIDDLMAGR
ncbi:MAG: acetyl-CoA decarbonylase/synthase complex subunit delta [Deltaproteobacteria bacterium]